MPSEASISSPNTNIDKHIQLGWKIHPGPRNVHGPCTICSLPIEPYVNFIRHEYCERPYHQNCYSEMLHGFRLAVPACCDEARRMNHEVRFHIEEFLISVFFELMYREGWGVVEGILERAQELIKMLEAVNGGTGGREMVMRRRYVNFDVEAILADVRREYGDLEGGAELLAAVEKVHDLTNALEEKIGE